MGEITNNPMMRTARGMVGKTVVFRTRNGKQVVANRPRSGDRVPTADQLKVQEKFAAAASYAKQVLLDAPTKALYQTRINSKKPTARAVAMTDYLNAPEVREIDTTEYTGAVGDVILISAVDDFQVTKVKVSILAASGAVIESGLAVQGSFDKLIWTYTATVANAAVAGTSIQAIAFDLPNNKGSLSKVL